MIKEEDSGEIVATAMGLDHDVDWHPGGAQFGWLACDPEHRGKGLGLAVASAVINKPIELDYENIHLGTEDFRLAAIKIYFKLGFVPVMYDETMEDRWKKVKQQI